MRNQHDGDHPPDEALAAWREPPGDGHPTQARQMAAHVATCPQCAGRLAQLAALDRGLTAWGGATPAVPPAFSGQVLAALPPPAASAAPRAGWGGLRRQGAALGFMLAGLADLVLSGDALAGAVQWWTTAGSWLGTAATADSSTWLAALPTGSLESHLGVLPGVVLLGIGALLALARALAAPRPRPNAAPPGRVSHA